MFSLPIQQISTVPVISDSPSFLANTIRSPGVMRSISGDIANIQYNVKFHRKSSDINIFLDLKVNDTWLNDSYHLYRRNRTIFPSSSLSFWFLFFVFTDLSWETFRHLLIYCSLWESRHPSKQKEILITADAIHRFFFVLIGRAGVPIINIWKKRVGELARQQRDKLTFLISFVMIQALTMKSVFQFFNLHLGCVCKSYLEARKELLVLWLMLRNLRCFLFSFHPAQKILLQKVKDFFFLQIQLLFLPSQGTWF